MNIHKDTALDDCFNDLHSDGFVHIKDYFSKQDISTVRDIIDTLVSKHSEFSDRYSKTLGPNTENTHNNIYEINRACGLARKLKETNVYISARLLAEKLLHSKAFYSFDHIIYKDAHSGSVNWHQDQAYKSKVKKMKSVHLWIPLHDISADGGGMQYIRGSNKGPIYPHHKYEGSHSQYIHDDNIDLNNVVKCNTKMGDVVAHLPETMHSSMPNKSDEMRRAWILHFSPYGQLEPLLPINLIHYLKSLMKS